MFRIHILHQRYHFHQISTYNSNDIDLQEKKITGVYFLGYKYHGTCGFGRFYNSDSGKCVKARPEVCDPGHSNRASSIANKLEELRAKQQLEQLELRQDGTKVVCYVTSWAFYRKGEGKFVPEHLDTRLCTHIIYAYAGLNPDTLLIHSFDPWADIENS